MAHGSHGVLSASSPEEAHFGAALATAPLFSLGTQQAFVEAAEGAIWGDEVGFDDPEALAAEVIWLAELVRVVGIDARELILAQLKAQAKKAR